MGKIRNLLVASGVAAAVISMTATMATGAVADPASGVTPRKIDIVGTGSDTTQLLLDRLSKDFNKNRTATQSKLYSWDAVGSSTITEKAGCAAATRPNGSSAGITELEANNRPASDTTHYCVDFARSSRPRSASDPADPNTILFLPYAIDAVTWSADKLTGSTHATASLSTKQLNAIYSCDASLLGTGRTGPVTWREVGGTSTDKIIPVIPQSSSGTRKFFLTQIGVTTLGSCVRGQDDSVEENEGTNTIFKNKTTAPDIIFPYSVAVYLAQTQGGHGTGTQGKQVLRKVNGVSPTVKNKTTGKLRINTNFDYLRFVYNVVRNAAADPSSSQVVPAYLRGLFGNGTAGSGWLCKNATAKADIASYGFLPTSLCGTIQ